MSLPASITDELLSRLTNLVASSGGETYKMTEVYTGEVITALPQSSEKDIADAFAEARRAQAEWASWPVAKRMKVFKKFHALSATVSCSSRTTRPP